MPSISASRWSSVLGLMREKQKFSIFVSIPIKRRNRKYSDRCSGCHCWWAWGAVGHRSWATDQAVRSRSATDGGMESAPARVLKVRGIYPLVIEETRSRLGVASVGELVDSDLSLFGQFLTALAGSRIAMFEKYGSTYCKKIAYEHTQAEDRSQRFNYKRRLIQCKILCPDASEFIDDLFTTYMSF